MRNLHIPVLLLVLLPLVGYAQAPANDECVNAIPLTDLTLWCSGSDAYTTINATASAQANPSCFPNNQASMDVWFSFMAQSPAVSISVSGDTNPIQRGTLRDPQFALYGGPCDNLGAPLACASDNNNVDGITLFQTGLEVGRTYYLRVGARFMQTGTFELCINNYNEVPPPDGDCPTAVILCDKSPFSVGFLAGVGNIPNEISNVSCASASCPFTESSSTWYKWTCDQSGPLAFVLTPANPADDLDFVVFELPNGLNNCAGKVDLRCMASGENVGAPAAEWAACTGQTGLSLSDPDVSETCGCQPGNNNFARAIDMVAGRSYALVINNFSQSGAGFTIEFDQSPGTGTFLGPDADFNFQPSQACVGEAVTYTDASSFIGVIEERNWDFGPDATPRTATGIGPHQVVYDRPGIKAVVLEIVAERGCVVTRVDLATEVICCDDHFTTSAAVSDVDCPDSTDGAIDFSVSNSYGPYGYTWSTGANTQDLTGLPPGSYTVTVVDEATCEDTFTFTVDSPPPFALDTLVVMPTCNGGTDGAVTLVVTGGTPPYQYNWQNTGFGTNNGLTNIGQGDYTVVVRDANGCTFTQVLPVRELELTLDPAVQAIVPPTCFGFSNGSITIAVNNGLPPYQYNFNLGGGFGTANTLNNIPAGTYQVDVLDANLCQGNFDLVVLDYPPLTLDLPVENVSCFGESDGSVTAAVTGGFGNYTYTWSNGTNTPLNDNLPAGTYSVVVRDANLCTISGTATVVQPDSLGLSVVDVVDNVCFGESAGSITVAASGGNPPYEYSTDGFNFQDSPVLGNLPAGDYEVTVLDAEGCTATATATITEPPQLLVDAGRDRFIILGYDTIVRALSNYNPVTFEWSPTDSLACLNSDCSTVLVNPTTTTTYVVTVINEAGCIASDAVVVRVIKDRPVYVPNMFSANADGTNDGFTVFGGPGLAQIDKLQIFSRWGELVFETKNIAPNDDRLGWDGRFNGEAVNPGVFVYVAQFRFVDEEVIQVEGDVTVVR